MCKYLCTSNLIFCTSKAVLIKHRKAQTSQVNVFGVCSHAFLCARACSPESRALTHLRNVLQVRFLNDSM